MFVACWCLDDQERRDRLERDDEQLRLAFRVGFAMWDGKQLQREQQRFLDRLHEDPLHPISNSTIVDEVRAVLAAAPSAVS